MIGFGGGAIVGEGYELRKGAGGGWDGGRWQLPRLSEGGAGWRADCQTFPSPPCGEKVAEGRMSDRVRRQAFSGYQGARFFSMAFMMVSSFLTGHDDDLWRLARLGKAFGESLDRRIAASGGQGGHVQHRSHIGAPAPDETFAAMLATLVGQRRVI